MANRRKCIVVGASQIAQRLFFVGRLMPAREAQVILAYRVHSAKQSPHAIAMAAVLRNNLGPRQKLEFNEGS